MRALRPALTLSVLALLASVAALPGTATAAAPLAVRQGSTVETAVFPNDRFTVRLGVGQVAVLRP